MKNPKTLTLTIVLIVLAVLVTVSLVVGLVLWGISKLENSQIEDINGDSKELAVITDGDIEAQAYGCVTYMSSRSVERQQPSGVRGIHKDNDTSYYRLKAGKLSGIQTVNACKGNGLEVTYVIESTVVSGNFKIVITDENHRIIQTVPIDQRATVTIPTEAGKLYFVQYVGESAEVTVELWRTMP